MLPLFSVAAACWLAKRQALLSSQTTNPAQKLSQIPRCLMREWVSVGEGLFHSRTESSYSTSCQRVVVSKENTTTKNTILWRPLLLWRSPSFRSTSLSINLPQTFSDSLFLSPTTHSPPLIPSRTSDGFWVEAWTNTEVSRTAKTTSYCEQEGGARCVRRLYAKTKILHSFSQNASFHLSIWTGSREREIVSLRSSYVWHRYRIRAARLLWTGRLKADGQKARSTWRVHGWRSWRINFHCVESLVMNKLIRNLPYIHRETTDSCINLMTSTRKE